MNILNLSQMIFNLSQRKSCLLRGYVFKYMPLCKLTSNSHILLSKPSLRWLKIFTQGAEAHLLGATQSSLQGNELLIIELRSRLLTLGKVNASITLPSLNRSLNN